jgi:hypothetical protein
MRAPSGADDPEETLRADRARLPEQVNPHANHLHTEWLQSTRPKKHAG